MGEQYVPKPNSNMGLAIFTTLCCCLPLGTFAIIKASKVNELYAMQQYEAAAATAAEAKKWALIGIGVGFVAQLIYTVIYVIYGAAMSTQLYNGGF